MCVLFALDMKVCLLNCMCLDLHVCSVCLGYEGVLLNCMCLYLHVCSDVSVFSLA